MISEQELASVGKGQYLALLGLIGGFLADHGNEEYLLLPKSLVDAIGGLKLKESLNFLTRDFVLGKFSEWSDDGKLTDATWAGQTYEGYLETDNESLCVSCRMNTKELDHYIDEVRALGNDPSEKSKHAGKKSVEVTKDGKIRIVIDVESGIYLKDNRKKIYPIYGARKDYVIAIYKNNGRTMEELQKIDNQSQSVVSRGIKEINSIINEKLGVRANLIVNNKTAGKYMLNKENFSFVDPRHVE